MGRIVVTLDAMLARRGMRLKDLAARTGLATVNLSLLKNEHARAIRFSTLAALCEALDCKPADILDYDPEDAEPQEDGSGADADPGSRGG